VDALPKNPVTANGPVQINSQHPKLAENLARMSSLAAIVLDDSGSKTKADKISAYLEIDKMAVTQQFEGSGRDTQNLYNEVFRSKTGQEIQELQETFMQSIQAISGLGRDSTNGQMLVDIYDTYSASDQAILFDSIINPTYMGGVRKYADEAAWRANVRAQDTLSSFIAASEKSSGAQKTPAYAEARALLARNDTETPTWTALVLKLFGETSDYRLDLSAEARAAVGDTTRADRDPKAYEAGSIASRRI
jgi:hypothetical protein